MNLENSPIQFSAEVEKERWRDGINEVSNLQVTQLTLRSSKVMTSPEQSQKKKNAFSIIYIEQPRGT